MSDDALLGLMRAIAVTTVLYSTPTAAPADAFPAAFRGAHGSWPSNKQLPKASHASLPMRSPACHWLLPKPTTACIRVG